MPKLDRRQLLRAGVALAVPVGGAVLLGGCQPSAPKKESSDAKKSESTANNPKETKKDKKMNIQFLEIVTPKVDALCDQYSAIHGVKFSDPNPNLGNARTTKFDDGGILSIRAPLRETETPVVRPYMQVDDLEKAVTAAEKAGAEIAIRSMPIPEYGTIAIVIQGGIECGLWQN